MRRILFGGARIAALLFCGQAWGLDGPSRAVVLDGDTLRLGTEVVGLHGISAPGPDQTCERSDGGSVRCGRIAMQALAARIGEAEVACEARGLDRHGRPVAVCRVGGEDLAAWMVGAGHAVADRASARDYVALEDRAWAKRTGLWAGVFEDPAARRRRGPGVGTAQVAEAAPPVALETRAGGIQAATLQPAPQAVPAAKTPVPAPVASAAPPMRVATLARGEGR